MITIRVEEVYQPVAEDGRWSYLNTNDGAVPLSMRVDPSNPNRLLIALMIDTDQPGSEDLFLVGRAGEDLSLHGRRLAPILTCWRGAEPLTLLLVLPDEPEEGPQRRVTHPALLESEEDSQEKERPPSM